MKKDQKVVDGKVYDNETETWNEPELSLQEESDLTSQEEYDETVEAVELDETTEIKTTESDVEVCFTPLED